jgi:hypothetical protein
MMRQSCSRCSKGYTLSTTVTHVFEYGLCPECWSDVERDGVPSEEINAIGIQGLKDIDDLDTRREIIICFEKLSEFERISFLHWCCRVSHQHKIATSSPPWNLVVITNPSGDVFETFRDFCGIIVNYGLPLRICLAKLEQLASKSRLIVPNRP